MISFEGSIVINAPVSEVYAYVGELGTMPDWLIGLVKVDHVVGAGEGQQCDWTFKLVGIQLRGQAVVVECVPDQRSTHQTIGMIDATWTSIVEPHGDGSKLTIEVDYTLPGAVFGKLAEHLTVRRMERDLSSSLLNIKEILEG